MILEILLVSTVAISDPLSLAGLASLPVTTLETDGFFRIIEGFLWCDFGAVVIVVRLADPPVSRPKLTFPEIFAFYRLAFLRPGDVIALPSAFCADCCAEV